jgi:hypothetical protein
LLNVDRAHILLNLPARRESLFDVLTASTGRKEERLRVRYGRLRAAAVAVVSATLALALIGPAVSAAKAPPGLTRFMSAIAQVESSGRYTARNATTGAYGKYQILPSNWPHWAEDYLGDRRAAPTPANQEKVAAGKFSSLYASLGSWPRVAYWWLTGSSKRAGWSAHATWFVDKVMRLYEQGAPQAARQTTEPKSGTRVAETASAIRYQGTWKTARHGGYAGNAVRYATTAGATATLSFTGTKVAWYGPKGPTRGQARILIDGTVVKTIDLKARRFGARNALFSTSWPAPGAHTLTIEVVGTKARPMVAIDEFVVWR